MTTKFKQYQHDAPDHLAHLADDAAAALARAMGYLAPEFELQLQLLDADRSGELIGWGVCLATPSGSASWFLELLATIEDGEPIGYMLMVGPDCQTELDLAPETLLSLLLAHHFFACDDDGTPCAPADQTMRRMNEAMWAHQVLSVEVALARAVLPAPAVLQLRGAAGIWPNAFTVQREFVQTFGRAPVTGDHLSFVSFDGRSHSRLHRCVVVDGEPTWSPLCGGADGQ